MPTTVACPSCTHPLNVPDQYWDSRVRCPACTTVFIPASTPDGRKTRQGPGRAPLGGQRQPRRGPVTRPPLITGPLPGRGRAIFAQVTLALFAVVCLTRAGAFGLYYAVLDEGWGAGRDELVHVTAVLLGLLELA